MFIYFLTTDLPSATAEADSMWRRIAVNRWATPERDDIRIIQHMRNFQLIPGGSYIIPATDIANADPAKTDQPWRFKELVDSGSAQWLANPSIGDAATRVLVARIKPPPAPLESFVTDQDDIVAAPLRDSAPATEPSTTGRKPVR